MEPNVKFTIYVDGKLWTEVSRGSAGKWHDSDLDILASQSWRDALDELERLVRRDVAELA